MARALYQEIESPADQEATILIGHDDAAKLWLNGEKVHEDRRHNAATPAASRAKVKLKKGSRGAMVKVFVRRAFLGAAARFNGSGG